MRFPVKSKMALHKAGAKGCKPGSPTPPDFYTSMSGTSTKATRPPTYYSNDRGILPNAVGRICIKIYLSTVVTLIKQKYIK